jgi:hypothetical protein
MKTIRAFSQAGPAHRITFRPAAFAKPVAPQRAWTAHHIPHHIRRPPHATPDEEPDIELDDDALLDDDDLDRIVNQAIQASTSAADEGDDEQVPEPGSSTRRAPAADLAAAAPAAERPEYHQRPQRRRTLADLLQATGYGDAVAAGVPDLDILNIATCNSESAGAGSLYVCVPGEGGFDGHDWADEAEELGAVAVIASRPLPDALLPVIVVDDTLQALGKLAAEFYGRFAVEVGIFCISEAR